jgi:uncharacterized protein YkwD
LIGLLAPACSHTPIVPDQPMVLGSFDGTRLASAIFEETNRVRVELGRAALAPDAALDGAADEQAAHMALTLTVEHENPSSGETDVVMRVEKHGLDPAIAAENVITRPARRPVSDGTADHAYKEYAALLVDTWMHSPGHRSNILDRRVTYLGCVARTAGSVRAGGERIFADQVFFLPAERQGELGGRSR